MFDHKKRNTLKALGAATVATALPSQALLAGALNPGHNEISNAATEGLGVTDLKIEIITSKNARHNTVILTNLSKQTLPVKNFLPGSVIWDEQYLDLNSLRGHVGLNLAAGSAMNLSVHQQRIQHAFQSEYIWADDAITPIDKDTNRILLGAYLTDGQLYTYPIPNIRQFA